jgi:ABC-2 type transport system permease protein
MPRIAKDFKTSLFFRIGSLEIRKLMSYRVDFWIRNAIGILAQFGLFYFLWLAIFQESGKTMIGGFSFDGMIFYSTLSVLFSRFIQNRGRGYEISREIYEGTYTKFIIYPVSYFRFKYAQNLGASLTVAIQVILFGALFFTFLNTPPEANFSLSSFSMAFASILLAHFLNFLIFMPIEGIAFWADNVWTLMVMARLIIDLTGGALIPLTLFPDWAHEALLWTPFPYLFHIPIRSAMGLISFHEWLFSFGVTILWCLALFFLGQAFWKRGDRQYTGVGI